MARGRGRVRRFQIATGPMALVAAAVVLASLVLAGPAGASLFTSNAPITAPGCVEGDCSVSGIGDPYPTSISVKGLPATVAAATATLRGITHNVPEDIDALLVGPGGQQTILMSDACGTTPLTGQTLFFNDSGPPLPVSGPCPNGTYKPTDHGGPDPFVPPAPGPPYKQSLSEFAGAPSNGLWRLFVVDDGGFGGTGSISGGWRLELLPRVSCAGKPATVAAQVGTAGDDVLTGTPGPDVMLGLGGNDTISGLGGKDVECGGPGKDTLKGGAGADKLKGQGGKDKLKGQGGNDTCLGGAKADKAKACETRKSI